MAKQKIMYECMACGYESPKWLGKCPNCGGWNQMEEQLVTPAPKVAPSSLTVTTGRQVKHAGAKRLEDIQYIEEDRQTTTYQEFDRVLGLSLIHI